MDNLSIEYRDPRSLAASPKNARTHSAKQVRQIADSIRSFGFNNPVLLGAGGEIIAGHGRVRAALQLALPAVPTVRIGHLNHAQRRAYLIADNRLAETAGWDREILSLELEELAALDLDFVITDTGFEMAEIDFFLEERRAREDGNDEIEQLVAPGTIPAIARRGELWQLGEHRLYCGDALDPASYVALMAGEKAEMVFTDPPYNVPVSGHVSGLGQARHPEFVMASGEMSPPEFTEFLREATRLAAEASKDGAIHFVCMDWRHLPELFAAAADVYSETKNLCVWVKTNGGMGTLYRSQHEMVAVFKVGRGRHVNNIELGKHGRYRTNVWTYAGMNSFHEGRERALAMHPTVKPLALVRDAILDCSSRKGIVLDPFAGAGTTLLAAEETGRRARLIELDPLYVDVTLHRYAATTGKMPVNLHTGEEWTAYAAALEISNLEATGVRND